MKIWNLPCVLALSALLVCSAGCLPDDLDVYVDIVRPGAPIAQTPVIIAPPPSPYYDDYYYDDCYGGCGGFEVEIEIWD